MPSRNYKRSQIGPTKVELEFWERVYLAHVANGSATVDCAMYAKNAVHFRKAFIESYRCSHCKGDGEHDLNDGSTITCHYCGGTGATGGGMSHDD